MVELDKQESTAAAAEVEDNIAIAEVEHNIAIAEVEHNIAIAKEEGMKHLEEVSVWP